MKPKFLSSTKSLILVKEIQTYSYYENIILPISQKSGGMNLPNERM